MLQFLVESPYEKKLYRLGDESILIGRSRAAEIPLLDETVRKRHVVLRQAAGGLRFEDLSHGGTRRNGETAREGPLRVGDSLQVGATTITLQAVLSRPATGEIPRPAEAPSPPPERPAEATREEEEAANRSVRLDAGSDDAFLAGGLRSVLEINKKLARERDEERLLALVMDAAIDLTGAERGFLLLAGDGKLEARVARNLEGDIVRDPELKISRSIAMRAIRGRRAVLSSDAGADSRWSGMESVAALRLRSVLSVPLVAEEGVLGALYLDNRLARGVFASRHVRLLEAFADQAAAAIVAFRLAERLRLRTEEVEELNARLSVELSQVREDLESRQRELEFKYDYAQIVGRSPAIRHVLKTLDKVTELNVPVFIEGESGTGKELAARALHFNGPRKRSSFVTENCSAIPETLIEKVLFGHVKGAFTGADRDAPGLFEQANGGTLFLDEVGDMSPEMQKKILRVLQEEEVRRVGGKEVTKIDARIVCATNRDVEEMREEGAFREDLFWRLVVVRIRMPPLRERTEDIPLLVDHFLGLSASEMEAPRKTIAPEALDLLIRYPWPGNVRELANEVRRAVALAGDRITEETLSERIRHAPPAAAATWAGERTLKEAVEELEKSMIAREIERTGGNKTRAAAALGLSRLGLRNKIERYELG